MKPWIFIPLASLFCPIRAAEVMMTVMGDQCFTGQFSAMAPIYDLSDSAWSAQKTSVQIPNDVISYAWEGPKKVCRSYDCKYHGMSWTRRSSFEFDERIDNLIIDHRWEEFPTYLTKHIDRYGEALQYLHMADLRAQNFMVSFSLQIEHEAHVFLCSGPSVPASYCEWIMIDAWEGKQSAFRSCEPSQIQAVYDGKGVKGICRNSTSIFEGEKLTEVDRWHHYKIIKNGSELTFLSETEHIFKRQIGLLNVGPYVSLFFHSKRVNGLWKLHLFNYYHTSTLGKTTFKLETLTGYRCVSIFVTMCYGCRLDVEFLILGFWRETPLHQKHITFDEEGKQWEEVNCCFVISQNELYLRITTLNPALSPHPYWAFHNVQISPYNNNLRILKPSIARWTGKCQYLWTKNLLDKNTESIASLGNWQQCREFEFGEDCTPCNITRSTGLCQKSGKYCQLFRRDSNHPIQTNCYCSIGYEGPRCQTACSRFSFGHSCQRHCANCQDGCSNDTIHGKCNSQYCTDNYMGEKCDIPPGIFIFENPPEIQAGAESCNLTLKSFEGIGNVKAMTKYVFQYREKGLEMWNNFPYNFLDFGNSEKAKLKALRRHTQYELRVFGFINIEDLDEINKSNNHLAPKLPIYSFKTSCKVIEKQDLSVKATKDSVEIYINLNKAGSEACTLNSYDIKLNRTIEVFRKEDHFAAYNLEPFTQYSIQVIIHEELVIDVSFRTLESVSSRVRDFIFTDRTCSSIYVQWQPPQKANGKLLYYRITATLKRFMACPAELTEPTVIHFDIPTSQLSANLTGLRPYSLYAISIVASTSVGFGESEHLPDDVNTNGLDQIQDMELPRLKGTIPGATVVSFRFSNTFCEFRMGVLRIKIDVWGSPGCAQSSLLYDVLELVEVVGLTPFCSYRARFQLSRGNSSNREFKEEVKFVTLEGVPNVVQDLLETSKGPDHIALRWLPPHPSTGILESYIITISYNARYWNSFNFLQNVSFPVIKCKLWPELEYHCATVKKNIKNNYIYLLEVRAKNKGNDEYSKSTNKKVKATEIKPDKPLNFDYSWTAENYLNLKWHHPNQTNGLLKSFDIYIDKIMFPSYIIGSEDDYRPIYFTQITNASLPFAKQFYVKISARNSNGTSDNDEWLIWSPPPIPQNTIEATYRESSFIEVTFEQTVNQPNFNRFAYVFASEYGDTPLAEAIARLENHHRSSDEPLQTFSIGDWTLIHHSEPTKHFIEKLTISNASAEANYTVEPTGEYTLGFVWVHKYLNYTRSNYTIRTIAAHIPSRFGTRIIAPLAVTAVIAVVMSGVFVARRFKFRLQQMIGNLLAPLRRHDVPIVSSNDRQTSEPTYVNQQDVGLHELKRRKRRIATVRPLSVLDLGVEICPGVPSFKTAHSRRVSLEDFHDYVRQAIRNGELTRQHQLFPRGMVKVCAYGSLPENKGKNRYQNLTAYDHSRVVLKKINGDEFSDYINANFVDGYRYPKAYIATQGPKKNTIVDFWRMVWQNGVSHIVMVANVIEGKKKKTEQYWPELNQEEVFGDYKVTQVSTEAFANYECRRLIVQFMFSKPREITHLHFKMWPDHGVPLYPQSLVPFLQRLLSLRSTDFPLVVHCSAGVGRTGTIILCDISLRMAAYEGHVDMLSMLEHIRNQRPNMVDNIAQYKLAHLVVLNCLMGLRTGVKINDNFQESLKGLQDLDLQLSYIKQCEWQDEAMRNVAELEQPPLLVKEKNRFSNIVPDAVARVNLHPYPATTPSALSTYINAVQVDGFCHPKKFIVTQYPLPNTVADFWRMVAEQQVSVVVCLNELPLPSCKKFWPDKHTELRPIDVIKMTHVRTKTLSVCKLFTLEIHTSYEYQENQTWRVNLLHFIGWKYPAPTPNHSEFITFVEDVVAFSRDASRIVVSCYDGATASGLFVALSFLLEKVKLEQEVDVCQAVRSIRTSRKEFANTKEQLEFLYKAVVLHVEERFMSYANISSIASK